MGLKNLFSNKNKSGETVKDIICEKCKYKTFSKSKERHVMCKCQWDQMEKEDNKKPDPRKILDNIEAFSMGIVLDIANLIKDELKISDIKGSYKEVYDRYEKVCFKVLEESKKDMTKKQYEEEKESIEDELRNVDTFLFWCQHEEDIIIKVNKNERTKNI